MPRLGADELTLAKFVGGGSELDFGGSTNEARWSGSRPRASAGLTTSCVDSLAIGAAVAAASLHGRQTTAFTR